MATYVLPKKELTALAQSLNSLGLQTELRMPDEDDILGGVLVVWELQASEGERSDVVEVVNFWNPARRLLSPAANAIAGAIALEGIALRCVGLQDLIALKLYAGGVTDYADILQLLVRNPDIDLDQLRRVAGPFDENTRLDRLIAEAQR